MPGFAKQFALQTYVDDNGVSWNKRSTIGTGSFASAVDGHAAAGAHPVWQDTKRRRVRRIIYQDPTTFRTYTAVFFTAAAFALVALGDIIAVEIPGEVAAVNYNAVEKVAEKQPGTRASRNDPQHA
jgi:hypothetical protein